MTLAPIRLAGSALSLLAGGWATFVAYYGTNSVSPCPPFSTCILELQGSFGPLSPSELQGALFVVGAILAIDALVSFADIRSSFIVGSVLSTAVLAIIALQWGAYSDAYSMAAVVLASLAVVADFVASRPAKALSEQSNPMNLPVFG
jgi:hypothetical protein